MVKHKKQIEEIMSNMKCNINFVCYKSGFKNLRNTKDIPLESFVECSNNKNAWQCEYAFLFGSSYLCKCPLRVYILKNIKK